MTDCTCEHKTIYRGFVEVSTTVVKYYTKTFEHADGAKDTDQSQKLTDFDDKRVGLDITMIGKWCGDCKEEF